MKKTHQQKHSEEKLATNLKIKIVDHIADIDLPYFLFYHINKTLDELNYFKLSNLFLNIQHYSIYLSQIAEKYNNEMRILHKQASGSKKEGSKKEGTQYTQYYTEILKKENIILTLNQKTCTNIHTKYSVSTILTMKEYVHRRKTRGDKVQSSKSSLAIGV